MTLPKSPLMSTLLTLMLGACGISAFAQPEAVALAPANTTPVNTIYFRNLLLRDITNAPQPFATEVAGALRGRLLHESYSVSVAEPKGVSGVRLILRSIEDGVQAIVGHRITDADGKYEFLAVSPGKYSIEVDPKSVPTRIRSSGILVSRIGFEKSLQPKLPIAPTEQNTIRGIVFIDKDGDGLYSPQKDQPVSGAHITGNSRFVVSDADGSYTLSDLPTGRTGVLVTLTKTNDNAHVVLDLRSGPAASRTLNIQMNR